MGMTYRIQNISWATVRFRLVYVTWAIVTWNYFWFSHKIHSRHRFEHNDHGEEHGHGESNSESGGEHGGDSGEGEHGHEEHHHGRGAFSFDLQNPGIFLYGLALPLVVLTVAGLVWNPSTSTKKIRSGETTSTQLTKSKGEINVKKWTLICYLAPLLLIMLDGAWGSHMTQSQGSSMGWNLYIRICMSLMSPSGYAATWAVALFLIPVTKHSPILDWLGVTPVQALAFHRIAGWTGFWNSVLHGFLHLRHLMDVLNPQRERAWYTQLRILLIPDSFECLATQNPWDVFWGIQDPMKGATEQEANQCWLALTNATGMISVIAFALLSITSLPQVRRYSYALFYAVHIPTAWIMLIMAIWHYPTCALLLIPNIIYYLSFNIPVYITQSVQYYLNKNVANSPLVQANLIEGGSIELIFASKAEDQERHESRFAKMYCPSVSPLYHPFSIFSRQDMIQGSMDEDDANDIASRSTLETFSMLLRPSGPFTTALTEELFLSGRDGNLSDPLVIDPRLSPMIQMDSFYAGSFDWIKKASSSHDELLLVAGGVGIVPFLRFLPALQKRIEADTSDIKSDQFGPKRIHLHWYCREVGLASYVWYNYLRHHIQESWEKSPATQGRIKIHMHLTSLRADSSENSTLGEEFLQTVPNKGLQIKQTFVDSIRPVQDATYTQFKWLGLLLPGSLMVVSTILHWWWYKAYILSDTFRDDNLIIRSHAVVFTLVLAMVLSVAVEYYLIRKARRQSNDYVPLQVQSAEINCDEETILNDQILFLSKGRPPVEDVVADIDNATLPGVYLCGPVPLMESVEGTIRKTRSDCAFYTENSEM